MTYLRDEKLGFYLKEACLAAKNCQVDCGACWLNEDEIVNLLTSKYFDVPFSTFYEFYSKAKKCPNNCLAADLLLSAVSRGVITNIKRV